MQPVLMEMIAREKRFLDLVVRIQCADGVEIHASARRDTGPTPMSCFRVGRDPEEEQRVLGICRRPLGQGVWRQQGCTGGRDRSNSDDRGWSACDSVSPSVGNITVVVPARQRASAPAEPRQDGKSEDRCSRLADPADPARRIANAAAKWGYQRCVFRNLKTRDVFQRA